MSLETRIRSLASGIGVKVKQLFDLLDLKLNKGGHLTQGYLKTDSEGDIVIDTQTLAPTTPVDGIEYVMKDGVWVQLPTIASLPWNNITSKPTTFEPTVHNHNDLYYTESEIDNALESKSDVDHLHDDRYFTESEVTSLLSGKENSFSKNTAFNKSFGVLVGTVAEGNHTHSALYYTKPEVNSLLNTIASSSHTHDDRYYTKVLIDSMLSSSLGSTHNHDDRYFTESEVTTLLAGKASTSHNHNDLYYTETEINTIVLGLASKIHTHNDIYYTKAEVTEFLLGKANLVHNHDERYYFQEEVDAKLLSLENELRETIVVESNLTPPEGLPVVLPSGKTFGKYVHGDTIPGNLSLLQVISQAINEYSPAQFAPAVAVLTGSPSSSQVWEVGTTISINLTSTFTQNDAGGLTNYRIKKNGVTILDSEEENTIFEPSLKLSLAGTTYVAEISHLAGEGEKYNSLGEYEPNNIAAGDAVSNSLIYKGYMPIFEGSVATAAADSAQIIASLNKILAIEGLNNFILNTGTVNKIYQFWLPSDETLISVVDLDALNADITNSYASTSVNVISVGGDTLEGTLYTALADVPYLTNHRHKITIE